MQICNYFFLVFNKLFIYHRLFYREILYTLFIILFIIWIRLHILQCDSIIEIKFNRSLIFKLLTGKNKFFNSIVKLNYRHDVNSWKSSAIVQYMTRRVPNNSPKETNRQNVDQSWSNNTHFWILWKFNA